MSVTVYVPRETTACAMGANELAIEIEREGAFHGVEVNLCHNGSRGAAWLEPLVEVETENGRIAYGPVELTDLPSLFKVDFLHGGDHPLKLGNIEQLPWFKNQQRHLFSRVGLHAATDIKAYEQQGGWQGLRKALRLSSQQLVDEVKTSGLRGRGGAGFPTGIKWQTVLDCQGDQKYIVCNADEGDSGTFADRLLMEGDPFTLIEGMVIAALSVGANQGYIYLRSEYPMAHKILQQAIEYTYEQGFLGSDILELGKRFDLEIRLAAGAYICGEETSLLESIEGKRGLVRAKPPLPAIEGLFGLPTVVNNVLSLAAIPEIVANGGTAYAQLGVDRSKGTMPFQLAGNIKQGGLVEVPFGITLRELIYDFGGGTATGKPVKAVQVGGPLGAYLSADELDVSMDYESLSAAGAMLGHGGIVVFDDTVDMLQQARFAMEFCVVESCGKCTPCRIGSTRGVEILDKIIAGKKRADNLKLLDDLCLTMEQASLCAMGGLTPLPVRSAIAKFEQDC